MPSPYLKQVGFGDRFFTVTYEHVRMMGELEIVGRRVAQLEKSRNQVPKSTDIPQSA